MSQPLLQVSTLRKYFPVIRGLLFDKVAGWVKAVDDVSFSLNEGETFGLVGESGCGKTTIAKVILLLERATSGSIFFEGRNVYSLEGSQLKDYRHSVQAVFQDPFSSLDPRMRVGHIVAEPLEAVGHLTKAMIKERVFEVLETVGLRRASTSLFPHEFSGGQRQRIAMARALATNPKCVILDEPVSALDVSVRGQVMNMLKDLQSRLGLTYLFVAHDLAVVKYMSTRIGVMYLGKLVEVAGAEKLYSQPLHPYTKALLSAALPQHPKAPRKEIILPGEVPSPLSPPPGCRFHPRCLDAKPICAEIEPPLQNVGNNCEVACHLVVQ